MPADAAKAKPLVLSANNLAAYVPSLEIFHQKAAV